MSLTPDLIRTMVETVIILILSIAVHEFGHAIVADWLGDRLPRSQGRVTLNPVAHADPIGTLAFPVMAMLFSGGGAHFGWGRPVQVNPVSFDRRFRMRTAHMLVAIAGPAMNIVFGTAIGVLHVVLLHTGAVGQHTHVSQLMLQAVALNYTLFFFNLVPAHPLDGGTVVEGFLPDSALPGWRQFAVYGPFIIMGVIMIPGASRIFTVPAFWLVSTFYALLGPS